MSEEAADAGGRAGRLARTARVMGARRYRQARRGLARIRSRAGEPVAPAFARAVPLVQLEDLFTYPRKRKLTAYLLWGTAGLLGAHRFYLDREGSAVAQFLTGGGLMLWWLADAFLIPRMVRAYNRDQAERETAGRPPRALDFLETATGEEDEAATETEETDGAEADEATAAAEAGGEEPDAGAGTVPGWADDRAAGAGRLVADLAVVAFAGFALGAVSAGTGSWRAASAVTVIVLVIGLAPELSALAHLPGVGDLLRWAARLGLFYRYHDPGGPLSRAARPVVGLIYAPFRSRSRAETHLWAEIGGAFAVLFFMVDLVVYGASALGAGSGSAAAGGLVELPARFAASAITTLVVVYAFASPVGATLYEHVLAGRSHRRVWLLGGTALAALAAGLLGS